MFILEEPYISQLLLKTLEDNQYKVINNSVVKKYLNDYKLNIIDEKSAIDFYKNNNDLKLYSNSENSINWITKNFNNSSISNLIELCKNKVEFRKALKPLYKDFFFREISLKDIDNLNINEIKLPFIIKPAVGFLSLGVHKVQNKDEWYDIKNKIKTEVKYFENLFPKKVLNSSNFIIEEIIQGEEFALDAYYSREGKPVILNIFKHPFADEQDVSDRAYISSKEIIEENLDCFTNLLDRIGNLIGIKNFPIHIELIKNKECDVIPVEINPARFAGWCTTDLAYYAYGINNYEFFMSEKIPNWSEILKNKNNQIYYFAMAEVPSQINKNEIETFDYQSLKQNFSNILEFREIDYREKPMFAIIFGATQSKQEITKILQIQTTDYIKFKK